MAVTGVANEDHRARSQKYNGTQWTATRAFRVQTTLRADDADTVSGASGLPAEGAAHPNPISAAMYAKEISYAPYESETAQMWLVTVNYTSERQLDPTDPALDEILISVTGEIYQKRVQKDRNGDAVLNSAGDPFLDPPATRDDAHLIFRIRANYLTAPSWFLSHRNAVNNAPITIDGLAVGTGLAKVQRIEASEPKKRGSIQYKEVTLEVHVHEDGWKLDTLDSGLREKIDGESKHIINEIDKEEITESVALDGSGRRLDDPSPFNSIFLDFDIYPEVNFSVLPGVS